MLKLEIHITQYLDLVAHLGYEGLSCYCRMLAELVHKYPQLMLDHGSRLKECLDYFTFLPSNPASSIIRALCPLFQLSRDLQVNNHG